MIIILKLQPNPEEIATVEEHVRSFGYEPHTLYGQVRTVVACIGDETTHADLSALTNLPMVDRVMEVQKKHKLVSRAAHPEPVRVPVGDLLIGGGDFHVFAGPCAVESTEQTVSTAHAVAKRGATVLRGGAFKPRTSPYDFQGLGQEGLDILAQAKAETGLPVVTELVCVSDIERVCAVADIIQIGARNGLNHALLKVAAASGKPILLKRGYAATIAEWLLAAEYLAKFGNPNIILCERGIRTFETATRNTLDLNAVAVAKIETNLPVIVDPTHGTGRLDIVEPLSKAAAAVGADGIIVEVHPQPKLAKSDSAQQMTFDQFGTYMDAIKPFIEVAGKRLVTHTPPEGR